MIVNLSHIDLDGVGCQVIINKNFKKERVEYFNCNYNELESKLDTIESVLKRNKVDVLFITDLSINEPQMNAIGHICKLNPNTKVVVIDHHPSTKDNIHLATAPNLEVICNFEYCATKLVYDYFNNEPKSLNKFVTAVDAYDTWKTDKKEFSKGMELNDLFWSYRLSRFFNVVVNDIGKDRIKQDLVKIREERIQYFTTQDNKGLLIETKIGVITFFDKFVSWIQINHPNKYFYINATSYGRIQIRLTDWCTEETSLRIQAEVRKVVPEDKLLNFGGHHLAFTLSHNSPYNESDIKNYIKAIYDIIDEEIECLNK